MYAADSEFWWNGELSPTDRLDLMLIAGAGISSNEIRHMFIGARWESRKNKELEVLKEKNRVLTEALERIKRQTMDWISKEIAIEALKP